MLDQVRGSKELEIVLNHTTNAWEDVTEKKSANFSQNLARLKLAIKLRQKAVSASGVFQLDLIQKLAF